MYLMNSSVTVANATSVISSLCLEMRPSKRSKGPVKLASRTSKPALRASEVPASGATAGTAKAGSASTVGAIDGPTVR
ncbi:hypothetical protein D3C73_1378350 [compost metagenome]